MTKPILFCATGITHSVGGIASANRNVLAALQSLAQETGGAVKVLALGENTTSKPDYRTFGGDKIRFALAAARAALTSRLVVFDHVQLAAPVMALPAFFRPPVVICAHGSEATWRIRSSSVRAFQRADLVLTNSHYTLGRMGGFVGTFAGRACPLGLPPQFEVQPAPPVAPAASLSFTAVDGEVRRMGSRVLVLVSRMDASEREKGHRELLGVFPRLLSAFPDAQLVLVGSGSDLEPLREAARASSAATGIFLPGRMDAQDLEELYRAAYAYVMPSRQEGFGLAYLEAMNFAKPCLACRDDGGGEVVVDQETGLLIPRAFTEDELFSALQTLLADPARAREFGEAGWRRLISQYTSAAHQHRVEALIRPLLAS